MQRTWSLASDKSLFHSLAFWLTFLSAIEVATLLLSMAKVSISRPVAWGILFLAGLLGWIHMGWLRAKANNGDEASPAPGPKVFTWPAILIVALTLLLAAGVWLHPDLTFDGNTYHIPTIGLWALKGYVHWAPEGSDLMNGYPKGAELLSFVLVKALGGLWPVHGFNLLFLPLAVLSLAWMSRRFGAPPSVAVLCGSLFLIVPVTISQTPTTYVDLAFGCCAVVTLILMASFVGRLPELDLRLAPSLGMALGLAAAVKPTGLLLLVLGGVLVPAGIAVAAARGNPARRRALLVKSTALLAVALITIAIAGYWYIRNYAMTGTPLYPVGLAVGERVVFPGKTTAEAIAETANTPERLRSLPGFARVAVTWSQTPHRWPATVLEQDSRLGGLGYLWLLGCLPALVFSLARRRDFTSPRDRVLWVLTGLTVAAFVLTPMNWWARYTLWVYAAGLPALGLAIAAVYRPENRGRLARFWLTAVLLVILVETAFCSVRALKNSLPPRVVDCPGGIARYGNWKWPDCYLFSGMDHTRLASVLAGRSGIAVGPCTSIHESGRHKQLIYGQVFQPIGSRAVLLLPLAPTPSHLARLEDGDISHVLWDDTLPVPPAILERVRLIEHPSGFLLYEVLQATPNPPPVEVIRSVPR